MIDSKIIYISCLFNFYFIVGYGQINEKITHSMQRDTHLYRYDLLIIRDTTSNVFIEKNATMLSAVNLDSLIKEKSIQKLYFDTYLKEDLVESIHKLDGKLFSEIHPFNFSKEVSKYKNGQLVQRSLYEIEDNPDYASSKVSLHWYFSNNLQVSEVRRFGTLIMDSTVLYPNGMCMERFDFYNGEVRSYERYDSNGRLEILQTSLNKRKQIVIERNKNMFIIKKIKRRR
jgi:antitoxin component YwqK of YwqJK toxin-antitoxin module